LCFTARRSSLDSLEVDHRQVAAATLHASRHSLWSQLVTSSKEVRMRYLQFIPIIIAWLPHVIAGVAVVEGVASKTVTGAEKKTLVLDYLRATALRLGLAWGDQAVKAIELLIDAAVTILNMLGVFKHDDVIEPEVQEAKADAPVRIATATVNSDPELLAFMERTKAI
jgi:hypothetical protein